MILSIHQPSYWPWLGLLDKIAKSDVFVILDNVQLNKDSYQRRNIFLVGQNKKYLTIPIYYYLGVKINEAIIKDSEFAQKHFEILRSWYLKSPFFADVSGRIFPLYQKQYERLIEVVNETMFVSLEAFGIKTKVVLASELDVSGAKGRLIVSICKAINADTYLSGEGARGYFQDDDYEAFEKADIKLTFQKFKHPIYSQFNAKEFINGLGNLDFLFNCGFIESKKIFKMLN